MEITVSWLQVFSREEKLGCFVGFRLRFGLLNLSMQQVLSSTQVWNMFLTSSFILDNDTPMQRSVSLCSRLVSRYVKHRNYEDQRKVCLFAGKDPTFMDKLGCLSDILKRKSDTGLTISAIIATLMKNLLRLYSVPKGLYGNQGIPCSRYEEGRTKQNNVHKFQTVT